MPEDNVVELNNITSLDLPPERVLKNTPDDMESVIIIGMTSEGEEYFSSSIASGPETLWLIERAKHSLMCIVDEMTDEAGA